MTPRSSPVSARTTSTKGNKPLAEKALIAMSGGVDSSVAALLMQRDGYDCMGVTMKLYEGETAPGSKTCCTADDAADARSVAYRLGMPYYVFNMKEDFDRQVIARFVSTYEAGATPNPCIDCNRYLKFSLLREKGQALGCSMIATGHYARVERRDDGRWLLKKAVNEEKDQSYVLYTLTQQELAHTRFPLGGMTKTQVRAMAEENGLLNAHKQDSQDICFVPDGDYAAFIRRYTGRDYPAGDFVDENGKVLGRHRGQICYTVGQRRGLGVAADRPLYVCKKRLEENQIVLTGNEKLFSRRLIARDINLIPFDHLDKPIRCKARVRYKHAEQPATVTQIGEDMIEVVFDEPQRAITAGQAVVLYDGDLVLGGGTICDTEES